MSSHFKARLDQSLVQRGLVTTRSQAESYIKLGHVTIDGKTITKPGFLVSEKDTINVTVREQYVSRAALKLASVAEKLKLDFEDKVVLDVGSSTGGFTDYALRHGARKAIAVDVGTEQMHPRLRADSRVELHEQTDIRNVRLARTETRNTKHESWSQKNAHDSQFTILNSVPDLILIDVSFISLRDILPHIQSLSSVGTKVVAMLKPQFEAGETAKHKGVIKNNKVRRDIFKHFEQWVQKLFIIVDKADSGVQGSKGNQERFYLLKKIRIL